MESGVQCPREVALEGLPNDMGALDLPLNLSRCYSWD